jgi:membrane protein implicated in regulation of membrane protease activity
MNSQRGNFSKSFAASVGILVIGEIAFWAFVALLWAVFGGGETGFVVLAVVAGIVGLILRAVMRRSNNPTSKERQARD